jgi:hypothetical protein
MSTGAVQMAIPVPDGTISAARITETCLWLWCHKSPLAIVENVLPTHADFENTDSLNA